ncbi:MAG: hypothetical protein ACLFRV_09940 [Acidimicrobiales bacterium]
MNQELALRVLSRIMGWDDERARQEFEWLRLMGDLKYDGYQDYRAGSRFVERLAAWLQQFESADRELAYAFVRNELVYVGTNEMERLVEQFFPRTLQPELVADTAAQLQVAPYLVRAAPEGAAHLESLQRKTLFMGLSDGARLDIIRHHHTGVLSNEQFVLGTQVDQEKWADLLGSLQEDLSDPDATFEFIYLLDDFVATGTTFVRYDREAGKWKGKLRKFRESLATAHKRLGLMSTDWHLRIHHYLASATGAEHLRQKTAEYLESVEWEHGPRSATVSFGMTLPHDLPIDRREPPLPFVPLAEKYYDPVLRTKHTDVGGAKHLGLGYGGCALPVVLDHNTPNNAVALLWADTAGSDDAHAMVPLFRRRQRHQ